MILDFWMIIHRRIHKSSPSSLELLELDDCEAQIAGLRLSFEEPLSPFISVYLEQVCNKLSLLTIEVAMIKVCFLNLVNFVRT